MAHGRRAVAHDWRLLAANQLAALVVVIHSEHVPAGRAHHAKLLGGIQRNLVLLDALRLRIIETLLERLGIATERHGLRPHTSCNGL